MSRQRPPMDPEARAGSGDFQISGRPDRLFPPRSKLGVIATNSGIIGKPERMYPPTIIGTPVRIDSLLEGQGMDSTRSLDSLPPTDISVESSDLTQPHLRIVDDSGEK